MPPKKKTAKKIEVKEEVFEDIAEFKTRMVEDLELKCEATERYVAEKRSDVSRKYFDLLRNHFSEETLKMNLYDFLAMISKENEKENADESESEIHDNQNHLDQLNDIQIKEEPTEITDVVKANPRVRDSVPANNQPAPIYDETVRRAPGIGRTGQLMAETPMGRVPFKMPRMITPKVTAEADTVVARALRPDEIGFSVSGSPIVGSGSNALFQDLLNKPEDTLSPDSQAFAANVKQFLRKKFVDE